MTAIRLSVLFIVMLATSLTVSGFARAQSTGLGPYDGPNITIDVDSLHVLSSNRAFDAWYPASTTKLMTAFVVFQAVRAGRVTMLSPVTISDNAAAQPPSKAGLAVGQVLTVENALRILMVKSANDIAVALAESVSGSEPAFIDEMNRAARALGMNRSTFTNPHGLPDRGQVTTAYDLALLTLALLREYPEYNDFYDMGAVRLGQARWTNHNILLQRYRGAFGFKTGYICDSGFNLVAGARRGGRTLITVTLGARSGLERAAASAHQMDEGFRRAGGLFGSEPAGTPLAAFSPTGAVQTEATRMRPIVCQRPRVRPSVEEIAAQFGTARPDYAGAASASAFAANGSDAIVLPSSGGESDGADEINVLDVMLGPVIREPQPLRISLGGATGPSVARLGRWLVPNPVSRAMAAEGTGDLPESVQAALPGQIAPSPEGPAVTIEPTVAVAATASSGNNIGQAVPIPVPAPIPRPN